MAKLVPDFILPHLQMRTYGRHLIWENQGLGCFKISRVHQSSDQWGEDCISVYKKWSTEKCLWKDGDPKRITKAKHRLITAMRKNRNLETLDKEDFYYRFRIKNYDPSSGTVLFGSRKRYKHYNSKIQTEESNGQLNEEDHIIHDSMHSNGEIFNTKEEQHQTFPNQTTAERLHVNKCQNSNKIKSMYTVQEGENCRTGFEQPLDRQFIPIQQTSQEQSQAFPSERNNADKVSATCICDVLLDNVVCNSMCIWHGLVF